MIWLLGKGKECGETKFMSEVSLKIQRGSLSHVLQSLTASFPFSLFILFF